MVVLLNQLEREDVAVLTYFSVIHREIRKDSPIDDKVISEQTFEHGYFASRDEAMRYFSNFFNHYQNISKVIESVWEKASLTLKAEFGNQKTIECVLSVKEHKDLFKMCPYNLRYLLNNPGELEKEE